MSSDNCIAILKTTDKFKVVTKHTKTNTFGKGITAYRVAHIQGVDNHDWYIDNEIHNLGCWYNDLFKRSKVSYAHSDAMKIAGDLQRDIGYTEYGIIDVDGSKYNFPGC